MMNILEKEDLIKGLPDNVLQQQMQAPTGELPQFLLISEIQRRTDMRKKLQEQPKKETVSEQIMMEGIMSNRPPMQPQMQQPQMQQPQIPPQMPPQMEPQMPPMQNQGIADLSAPPMGMAEGGIVRMFNGGDLPGTKARSDADRIRSLMKQGIKLEDIVRQGMFSDEAIREVSGVAAETKSDLYPPGYSTTRRADDAEPLVSRGPIEGAVYGATESLTDLFRDPEQYKQARERQLLSGPDVLGDLDRLKPFSSGLDMYSGVGVGYQDFLRQQALARSIASPDGATDASPRTSESFFSSLFGSGDKELTREEKKAILAARFEAGLGPDGKPLDGAASDVNVTGFNEQQNQGVNSNAQERAEIVFNKFKNKGDTDSGKTKEEDIKGSLLGDLIGFGRSALATDEDASLLDYSDLIEQSRRQSKGDALTQLGLGIMGGSLQTGLERAAKSVSKERDREMKLRLQERMSGQKALEADKGRGIQALAAAAKVQQYADRFSTEETKQRETTKRAIMTTAEREAGDYLKDNPHPPPSFKVQGRRGTDDEWRQALIKEYYRRIQRSLGEKRVDFSGVDLEGVG